MRPLVLSHDKDLTTADVLAVALDNRPVALAPATKKLLAQRRKQIEGFVADAQNRREKIRAYGFNTGFGHNVDLDVEASWLKELQKSLIHSHSSGVGPHAPVDAVRATMILRAQSLCRGHSAIRPAVAEALIALLNAGITPVVPRYGSVSASGDLAPLSHVALALIGAGDVIVKGKRIVAAKALRAAKIEPLVLEMKEGLALNNGVQYSTALGILAAHKFDRLLKTAAITTALSAQVMLGADTPFREDLHALRPHQGARKMASWVFDLMKNSPLREAHRPFDVDGDLQDPYNIRCAGQILGTCAELLERAVKTFEIETNSVTDNPILLPLHAPKGDKFHRFDGQFVDIVSGGHFHGMPVAIDLYGLLQATAIVSALSNLRCARAVDGRRNKGLGDDLKWPGVLPDNAKDEDVFRQAISSALMIPEYATASLTNAIWGLAMPSHLLSISTDAGQEDHVSMAANVGLRLHEALDRAAEGLAIELAFAFQAAAIRREMRRIPTKKKDGRNGWQPLKAEDCRLSPVCEAVLAEVGKHFKLVRTDRSLAPELAVLAREVLAGAFVARAEAGGMRF